ncbi:MAG TPA: AmmeMemoRadiSam system protein B [Anaeromyxobacter sp.]|nr:AmmeMemoRadiSam system protein B [Anaeromyxobacter sp.]
MSGERPRLIPVESREVTSDDGERMRVLRDPAGVALDGLGLSPAAHFVAAQLDGTRTAVELLAQVRAWGAPLAASELSALVEALEEAGFLEGPAREARRRGALQRFRAQRARPPACAGTVYPAEPAELRTALDAWLRPPRGPSPALGKVRLIIAPHIDYARGAAGYAHAYRALAAAEAELFVVFGTAHASPPHLFTLTRLDQETPLGLVPTDLRVVEALASELGEEELFGDELAHRDEHSIELQLVLLAHLVPRPFTVLPVLCSSISHLRDPEAATVRFHSALKRAVRGRRVCWLAGADLAHVGPSYGDSRPPSAPELALLAAADRRTLERVVAGDAAGFHREAVQDDERRRLCGVAPIHAALCASGLPARLLHYEQWTDGTDSVSFVAAAG